MAVTADRDSDMPSAGPPQFAQNRRPDARLKYMGSDSYVPQFSQATRFGM